LRTQQKHTSTSKYDDKISTWTIGHSNRSIEAFASLLREHEIKTLVDIRRFPTSKIEHFKKEEMERWLPEYGIRYIFLGDELGGYRRGGYQTYMKTEQFREGIEKLVEISKQNRTCIMCMEPNPKYCHRRFISAYLEEDVEIVHILKKEQVNLLKFENESLTQLKTI
jgi:uncharacterized protein (DUF488 family)